MIPVFDKYFPEEGRILEAGCGLGKYVIYYRRKGYDIEGVDFSAKAINSILAFDSSVPVRVADVTNLPFPDAYFKCYYSGGVIEHFENGPFDVLKEAHRVLEKGGIIIALVPQINLIKKIEDIMFFRFLKKRLRLTSELIDNYEEIIYIIVDRFKKTLPPIDKFSFHNYTFTKKEAIDIFKKAGFSIKYIQPVGIEYGLMNYKFIRNIYNKYQDVKNKNEQKLHTSQENLFKKMIFSGEIKKLHKKILVYEGNDLKIAKPLVWLLRKTIANLLLLVCRK